MLQNETDGTEHIFGLKGIGQEPLALDHIVIDCQVRQITQKVLMVPNYTNNRLTFKVSFRTLFPDIARSLIVNILEFISIFVNN